MEKEFVPYELALRMKALGFDEPCLAFYRFGKEFYIKGKYKNTKLAPTIGPTVPTFSQAFRWFRENHNIEATVSCFYNNALDITYEKRQYHCHIIRSGILTKGPKFDTHEKAELACLEKLIEIVESKSK